MADIKVEDIVKEVLPGFEFKPGETTIDEIKAELPNRYVSTDIHKKQVDEAHRKVKSFSESNIKKVLKLINVPDEEMNGKKYEELNSLLEAKTLEFIETKSDLESRIKDLSTKGSGATDAEKEELNNLRKELKQIKSLDTDKEKKIKELSDALEAEKKNGPALLEKFKFDQKIQSLYAGANWTDNSDDIDKKGVWATKIEGKYIFKADGDKIYVYHNDEEQTMVKDGVNQMTAEKFFEGVLKESKRFKENNGNSKPFNFGNNQNNGNGQGQKSAAQLEYEAQIAKNLEKMNGQKKP